jgi:Ras-related protein Rab-27A
MVIILLNILFEIFLNRDTAGQERFRSLTASFFRDAMGFLLVFDLTNEASFINVRNWISEIQANAYSENVDMILVGNKSDLENDRIIERVRALEFAFQNRVDYIETSALHNVNVAKSVELLLESVMTRLEQTQNRSSISRTPITLTDDQIPKPKLGQDANSGLSLSKCCY